MATNVLDKVAATVAKRAPVDTEYLTVVAKLGRGDNVTEAAVEAALASSGRTLDQMRSDVATMKDVRRRQAILAEGRQSSGDVDKKIAALVAEEATIRARLPAIAGEMANLAGRQISQLSEARPLGGYRQSHAHLIPLIDSKEIPTHV